MIKINSLTEKSKQRFSINTDKNESVDFFIYFCPSQKSWYYDFTYKNYTSKGNKIVLSPNSIRHLKNILPFGIAFLSSDKVEPFNINDFASGRVQMFLLDENEVLNIEEEIYGQ